MQTSTYGELSARLNRKVIEQRIPVNATLEVSRRCPLECVHCYNNLPMDDAGARANELTLDEIRHLLDEMAEAGVLWLCLTGGEIFARHDFLEIYDHAKRNGFLITLFTNGTMITEKIADHLAAHRPFAIEITLYGMTKDTYEELTRVPGSFDRCMRAIRLLKERNLPLKLKTVAVSINKHQVFEMQRFAREEIGVEFKFDSMMNPRIDCSSSPLAVRLSPAEVIELDLQDPRRIAEWKKFADRFIRPANLPDRQDEVYACGGGINSFAIDPDGKLSICVLSHFDTYDVREGSLAEGWNGFLRRVREKKITRPTKCTDCHLRSICGMCPANGELEHMDPEEPVDFLCQTSHLRAAVFDFPVPPHGNCEYCEGGEHHEALRSTAEALKDRREDLMARAAALPSTAMETSGCASGACDGCGLAQGH